MITGTQEFVLNPDTKVWESKMTHHVISKAAFATMVRSLTGCSIPTAVKWMNEVYESFENLYDSPMANYVFPDDIPDEDEDEDEEFDCELRAAACSPAPKVKKAPKDVTYDDARAKGYIKGSMEKEGITWYNVMEYHDNDIQLTPVVLKDNLHKKMVDPELQQLLDKEIKEAAKKGKHK